MTLVFMLVEVLQNLSYLAGCVCALFLVEDYFPPMIPLFF
jgi:hypothetical protein